MLLKHAIDKLIKILAVFCLFHDTLQNLVPTKNFIYHTNENQLRYIYIILKFNWIKYNYVELYTLQVMDWH